MARGEQFPAISQADRFPSSNYSRGARAQLFGSHMGRHGSMLNGFHSRGSSGELHIITGIILLWLPLLARWFIHGKHSFQSKRLLLFAITVEGGSRK